MMRPLPPSVASTPLAVAKRRAARRRSSDGAVMFVVAMTITVLAALGAWALQSSAMEVRMAGYERQSTQTHYVSEYGVLAAMDGLNPQYLANMLPLAVCGISGVRQQCLAAPVATNPNAKGIAKACYRWSGAQYLLSLINTSYSSPATSAPYALDPSSPTGTTPGSFGLTSMQGDFGVEMTDVAQGPAAAGNSGQSYWVTLSSYGRTSNTSTGTSLYNSEGDEILRTRILAPLATPFSIPPGCPP